MDIETLIPPEHLSLLPILGLITITVGYVMHSAIRKPKLVLLAAVVTILCGALYSYLKFESTDLHLILFWFFVINWFVQLFVAFTPARIHDKSDPGFLFDIQFAPISGLVVLSVMGEVFGIIIFGQGSDFFENPLALSTAVLMVLLPVSYIAWLYMEDSTQDDKV